MHLIGWLSLPCLVSFLEFWSVLSFRPYFFVLAHPFRCKGQSFRYSPGQGNPYCCVVVLYVGEGSEREQYHLLGSQLAFSATPTNHSKLGPSGTDSQVGGFVYILGPCGSLQGTVLFGWEFYWPPEPSQVFTARGFEAFFSHTGTLGCVVCLAPQLFLPVDLHANVWLPATTSPAWSSSCHLAVSPLSHGCPSYQSRWMFLL